jgi:hypothetical protein
VSFFASSLLSFSRVLCVLYLVNSLSSGPDHLRTTYIFAARPIPTLMLTPRPASNLSQSCNGSTAVGEGSSFGGISASHDNMWPLLPARVWCVVREDDEGDDLETAPWFDGSCRKRAVITTLNRVATDVHGHVASCE